MRSSIDRGVVVRAAGQVALVPPAAFAVHQLRFMLAFGTNATDVLARQGHAYLHSLVPWIVLLIALALGAFLWALGRAFRTQESIQRYTLSLVALWLVCSLCLLGIYVAQESLEGFFASGHPVGWMGVLGYGGWWSIPAALCLGLVLAALFHGARWALDEVAHRQRTRPAVVAGAAAQAQPLGVLLPRLTPLAEGWSGRGPPR